MLPANSLVIRLSINCLWKSLIFFFTFLTEKIKTGFEVDIASDVIEIESEVIMKKSELFIKYQYGFKDFSSQM